MKNSFIDESENSEGRDQGDEILLANNEGAGASRSCTVIVDVSFEKVNTVGMGSFLKLSSAIITSASFLLRMIFDIELKGERDRKLFIFHAKNQPLNHQKYIRIQIQALP